MTDAPVLVQVERSGTVESQHRGHVVVVDQSGAVVAHLGDPDHVVYPRSAVKPLQAAGMLQLGLDADGSSLALAAASHSGEPFHIEGVRELLRRAGLTQSALQCPADLPYGAAAREAFLAAGSQPTPVVMNCSGKHAAMLWTCVTNGWNPEEYLLPDHPLQRYLRDTIASLAGAPAEPLSTDGCGAPLYGLPLVGLARALQAMPSTPAGARVGAAMRAYPEFVGGTDRDITHLMRGVPGLVAKDGAEAVQAMVVDVGGRRFGIGVKIEDGAQRARSVVAAATLEALGIVTPVTVEHRRQPVLGGGRPVGWIRPSAVLDSLRVVQD